MLAGLALRDRLLYEVTRLLLILGTWIGERERRQNHQRKREASHHANGITSVL